MTNRQKNKQTSLAGRSNRPFRCLETKTLQKNRQNLPSLTGGSNRPFRCLESAIHNMEHISHLQLLRIFKTDNARETKPAFPYLTDCLQSTEHICDLYICQLKLLEPKETKCLLQLPRPVHIIRKLSVCSLETNSNALFSKTSVI